MTNSKILRFLLRSRTILHFAKELCSASRNEDTIRISIPETTPFSLSSSNIKKIRLNLVVPGISERYIFGGIATALKLFESVADDNYDLRIIVSDEQVAIPAEGKFYSNWEPAPLNHPDKTGNIITVAGDRYNKSLPIRENDFFIATAWWTAYSVLDVIKWQKNNFSVNDRKFTYLIQDFEPNFYPWSTRYAKALSTYQHSNSTIAVFNTSLLKEYFIDQGLHFKDSFHFEPQLNERLKKYINNIDSTSKKKKLIIYGRPSTERNAFELIIEVLMLWSSRLEGSQHWELISLGEHHEDISLNNGVILRSRGKVSLDEYAQHLVECSVGLSLMVSPHPSYPPLEIAAFGGISVTNNFSNKDLSTLHPNILSTPSFDAESISDLLINACSSALKKSFNLKNNQHDGFFFLKNEDQFNFSSILRKKLITQRSNNI